MISMPRKSRLNLPPLDVGATEIAANISRIRKRKGITQVQLAERIGLTQNLVSSYEIGRLRMHAELVIRFAKALEVSTDELLGVKTEASQEDEKASLKIYRRLRKIEELPAARQRTVLQSLDMMLKAAETAPAEQS